MNPTERTQLQRLPERGSHDLEVVRAVLDAAFLAHVGFLVYQQPFVIPTLFGRDGDTLYLHGSAASRMLGALDKGIQACVTATIVDGLVLARSAFHHSINYRSVVAMGTARAITQPGQKTRALRVISEHLLAGRWDDVRGPTRQELSVTSVLEFSIVEASAKIRRGPPKDDEEDYARSCWAGVLPLALEPKAPDPDPRLTAATPVPAYLSRFRKP
jgi:uncharacterized protein